MSSASTSLATGDLITVKATNSMGDTGFWCVIKLPNGQLVATTGDGWSAYIPADPAQWFQAKQIRQVTGVIPGSSKWEADMEQKDRETLEGVQQIWAPGGDDVCYFSFVVGPLKSSGK